MDLPLSIVIVLYVAAAALPSAGVALALAPIAKELKHRRSLGLPDEDGPRLVDLNRLIATPMQRRRLVYRDMALVISGLVCGAVASIWSLFL